MSEEVWRGEGEQSVTGVDSVSLARHHVHITLTHSPPRETTGQRGLMLQGGVLKEVRLTEV